jgi:hypothetical protein
MAIIVMCYLFPGHSLMFLGESLGLCFKILIDETFLNSNPAAPIKHEETNGSIQTANPMIPSIGLLHDYTIQEQEITNKSHTSSVYHGGIWIDKCKK